MKTKFLFISIAAFFAFSLVRGQDTLLVNQVKIDSLQQLIDSNSKNDEEKVRLLNEYARMCFYNQEELKGFIATHDARLLSEKLNFEGGKIMYYLTLSAYHGNGDELMQFYYQKQAQWLSSSNGNRLINYYVEPEIPEFKRGDEYNSLISKYSSILKYFEKLDDKEIQANILNRISYFNHRLDQHEEALKINDKIIKLYTDLGQTYPVFRISINKMNDLRTLGKEDEAKNIEVELALNILRSNDKKLIALASYNIANFYNTNNRYKLAIEYYLRSAEAFEELGDKDILPNIYRTAGAMYQNIDLNSKAFEQYNKIVELRKNNPDFRLYNLYAQMAYTLIPLKRYDEARKYMELSLQGITPERENNFRARYFDAMGQMLMAQENYKDAIPMFEKSYDFFSRDRNLGTMFVNFTLAKCYRNLGDLKKSIELGLHAYNAAEKNNILSIKINSSLFLSEVYDQNGQSEQAFKFLKIHQKLKAESDLLDNTNNLADIEIQTVLNKSNREIEKLEKERIQKIQQSKIQRVWIFSISGALLSALFVALILFRNNKNKQKANALLREQKEEIQTTLEQLEATQSQLIQSEKMASLGELTAGIAHEIQNPLNFVNNFSEVNKELITEMREEITKRNFDEVDLIAKDVEENEDKIIHHGKRAEAIVKGMLQHSRTSSGVKEPTDINALANEYLRLSYHGLRAKDKSFNADFKMEFDESLPKINVIPQDIGRVLLNLINNAFYAAPLPPEGGFKDPDTHKPLVTVSTSFIPPSGGMRGAVEIRVKDNGPGIPQNIVDKIFQPFFTTKPTGSGTGLGLSLSYDIVKAHSGSITVNSKENEGTEFIIQIPTN